MKWVDYYDDKYTYVSSDGTIKTGYADSLRKQWINIYIEEDVIFQGYGKLNIYASGNKALHFNTAKEMFVNKSTKDTNKFSGSWIAMWEKKPIVPGRLSSKHIKPNKKSY